MHTKQKWTIPLLTGAFLTALGCGFVFMRVHALYVPGMLLLWPGVVLNVLLSANLTDGFGNWRDVFFIVMGTWPSWTLLAFLAYRTRWGFPLAGLLAVFAIITAAFGMLPVGASLGVIGIGFAIGGFAYRRAGGKT